MKILSLLLFSLLLFMPSYSFGAAGEWQGDNDVMVRLISEVDGTGNEEQIPIGIEIKLSPGWHTYWRSAGVTGLPPLVDWKPSMTESGNLESADVLYPAPQRYSVLGEDIIGYRDRVVLPAYAKVKSRDKALVLSANLDLLVCNALCVPKHFSLSLTVPSGVAVQGVEEPIIKEAFDSVPSDAKKSGISIASIQSKDDSIIIEAKGKKKFTEPDIFMEAGNSYSFDKSATRISDDGYTVYFTLKSDNKLPNGVALSKQEATVTIVDGKNALEQKVEPLANHNSTTQPHSLWLIILLAIMGGFILNLTPCVLPVLSLKILSVISHGGGVSSVVRRSFLMTAGGILFSFLVLAGITIVLKETGQAIGWGVQFQQPVFLVFLIILLTFFAANLWGLFEIPLPRFLADRFDKLYHPKLAGDFIAGAFATLLATPCTAPFLGTAIGFALAAGAKEIVIIFTALGFGMILPYLAIAMYPHIAISLPRPGAWMIKLRTLLGWALALTAFWLLWVLTNQVSIQSVLIIGVSIIIIISMFHAQKRVFLRKLAWFLIIVFTLIPFGIAAVSVSPETTKLKNENWQQFDEDAIERYISEGKTVFVDITADWCLTCKVNKSFSLSSDEVTKRLFHDENVIAMQGDWTNPCPVISEFLKKHGRYGIPFNAIFSPKYPQGYLLPELLTPNIVINGLNKTRD